MEKDQIKAKLEEETKAHNEKMEHLLFVMKHEEYNIHNQKQKENLLQKGIEDIIGYMTICDWTLQHEFNRSNYKFDLEKLNPTLKGLIERDSAKIDKARQSFKESLLSMKKIFEKTEDVISILYKVSERRDSRRQ